MSKRRSSTTKLAGDVLKALLVLSRAVEQTLENGAIGGVAAGRLAVSRMRILMLLGHRGRQTSSHVAKFLGVSKSAVTQIIDIMVRSGLVRRRVRLEDRREVELSLTTKGRRTFAAILRKQTQVVRVALEMTKVSNGAEWVQSLHEITRSLRAADQAFENFCLQCGAHADGACVLQTGQSCYELREKQRPSSRQNPTKSRQPRRATA